MTSNTKQGKLTDDDLAHQIACELASIDGYDPDDMHCGLYDLRWSGGSAPEPLGDTFSLEYLPKGYRIARAIEQRTAEPVGQDVDIDRQRDALENIRLFAARNRKEAWALLILGFCAEGGVAGNPLRGGDEA